MSTFFDDIEKDIIPDNLISDNASKTLYEILYNECETAEDFVLFFNSIIGIDAHNNAYLKNKDLYKKEVKNHYKIKLIPKYSHLPVLTITKYEKFIGIYVGTEVCRVEIIRFNNILDECKILLPALLKIKNYLLTGK